MKKIIGVFCAILLQSAAGFAASVDAQSRISQVSVYPSGAFVTRTASVQVTPSDTSVVFQNIIPEFDENSLRVKGKGTADVKILGAQVKREYTEETPVARVKELEDQIQAVEDENAKLENERQVLAFDKQYLDSIRLFSDKKIPEDLVTKMPSAQDLEGTLVFLDTKMKENFARGQAIDLSRRDNNRKIEALRRELQQIRGPGQKMKRSVVVEIEVVKEGSLDLDISYMVGGASWEAVYDARAEFDKAAVELVSYGIVRQSSGENWDDVEMTLSTAQVNANGQMPDVNSWFIRPYQPPVPMAGPALYRSEGRMARKAKMDSLMMEQASVMADSVGGAAPMEMEAVNQYAQAQAKGVSVAYKLSRKATVKSDGTDHKLPVSSQTLAANFEYSAYPRAAALAYLRSRVTNAKDLQLLGGRVNVFLDGDFVGTSGIEKVAPAQEFDLYLGGDENVKIKRELLEQKSDDTLIAGIPSPNKKVTYKYKLTAENYKANASKVNLFEAIPVPEDERIKVKISQVSLEPQEKEWKNKKGVWRWELQLPPQGKQEIFYSVTVECPRDMRVEGLD